MGSLSVQFTGGKAAIPGWGDRWNLVFGGTWNNQTNDYWNVLITSTQGDLSIGVQNLTPLITQLTPPFYYPCYTFKERVFVGLGKQFNFSDNLDPTGWEVQNPGAGETQYLSNFGSQDIVRGFGTLQGRLAIFGRRSIQLWSTDADPGNFSLIQVIDNMGTVAGLSPQQLGDYDVPFLDDTGVRSLRSLQVTLNADIDDIGTPIDTLIRAALAPLTDNQKNGACAIVEPTTKDYWLFLVDTIYVLSRHRSAKISAWSTYEPRGSDNTTFAPQKFVILNGIVYCRSTTRGFYTYGGSNNTTYDAFSQVTVKTPYLDDKKPGVRKVFNALSFVQEGQWTHSFATDPQSDTYVNFPAYGSTTTPNEKTDSTYDVGVLRAPAMQGTHVSVKSVSNNASTSKPAILGQLLVYYNLADMS